jgi:hypothetical protein
MFSLFLASAMTSFPALPIRDDDEVTITAVSEMAEFMTPGPNTGAERLPTPLAPEPAEAGEEPAVNSGAVHLTLGFDVTNAYFWRGLRQEDEGVIFQPYASASVDLWSNDDFVLQGFVGTWNSAHSEDTGASATDDAIRSWYESDVYFGLTATTGRWKFGAQYAWFLSPNNAFATVQELQFSASLNDGDWLGEWAMSPSATVVIETGDGTSDGQEKGVYLQLGIEPGFNVESESLDGLRISVPIMVGLSAKDYYEDGAGSDEFFGFASAGVKASLALPVNQKYGAWSAYVSANALLLGDVGATLNEDEDTDFVLAAGVSMSY